MNLCPLTCIYEDVKVLFILGHPSLATLRALIDLTDGRMVLRVGDEKVILTLHKAIKHSLDLNDTCYYVDDVDYVVFDVTQD